MQLKAAPFPVGSPRSHLSNPISALSLAPTLLFPLWNLKLEPFWTWGQTISTFTQARLLLNSLPSATKSQYKSVKQPLEEALKLLCQAQSMAFVHFNQSRGWVLKLAKIEIENIFFLLMLLFSFDLAPLGPA